MTSGTGRLRLMADYLTRLWPDAGIEMCLRPDANEWVITVRLSQQAIADPAPVGLLDRDRERLLPEYVD